MPESNDWQKTIVLAANTCWYIWNFRANTIKMLIEQGYKVVVVAPEDAYSHLLTGLGCDYQNIYLNSTSVNPVSDLRTFFSYIRIYLALKPFMVLNFTPKVNIYSCIAARLCGSFPVNNIAGLGAAFVSKGIVGIIAGLLYRISTPLAVRVFFQNNEDKELFLSRGYVRSDKALRLPGSGVDLQRFQMLEASPNENCRFLMFCRMLIEKGVGEYVSAAKLLKQKYGKAIDCFLLGPISSGRSAISIDQIKEWEKDGAVQYLGVSDNVADLLVSVDCVVLPSYYREGVPRSLLEAAAMGKPIITTDNVGCRDVVDPELTGYLCKPKSVDELFMAMEHFFLLPYEKKIEMGLNSRKKIEREFDEKVVLEAYREEVERLAAEY